MRYGRNALSSAETMSSVRPGGFFEFFIIRKEAVSHSVSVHPDRYQPRGMITGNNTNNSMTKRIVNGIPTRA